jgi:DUF4097 and DUF4098 domain-containing protein YvlB
MIRKVGRITLAVALIGAGTVFLVDNFLSTSLGWYLARMWPALLIVLGLEWLYNAEANRREGGRGVVADPGAIVLLIIVAVVGASFAGTAWRIGQVRRTVTVPPLHIEVGNIASPFNQVSKEIELTQDLALDQLQSLSITSSSGRIYVQDGSTARVQLKVTAWGRSAEEAEANARQTQLKVDGAGQVTVRAVRPASVSYKFAESFIITLPKDAAVALKVDSSSGDVQIADRTGDVTATNSSGSLRADRIMGNVDLRTASGNVGATNIEGDLKATSSSGSVTADLVSGSVQANSTSGNVSVVGAKGPVTAQASSGSVNVTASTVGGNYNLGASSGSVRLMIPQSAGVAVDARSSSGTVTGPAWLTIGEGRNSGAGTQGDGAQKVTIRTSSGSITVEAR